MSSNFGKNINISIFGQSHSESIGVVIDGLPAGEKIDYEEICKFMARRAPGRNKLATQRAESDLPHIQSGIINGYTCGAPLCAIIKNDDVRSEDYNNIKDTPRPSHADYPAYIKYKGFNDTHGGGHFSGRLTAPLCFAGAVCKQILEKRNIIIGSHIYSIADVYDTPFDPIKADKEVLFSLSQKDFPVISEEQGVLMREQIKKASDDFDSVGGIIECCILNVPTGIGNPMFDGVENRISAAVFGIPAVRGIEFGAGFSAAFMRGSEHNDEYFYDENKNIKTRTNNHGGILGGITTGMPIIFRTAFKPVPSIAQEQNTIDLKNKANTTIKIKGRHDSCIVMRAAPCVESAAAISILDLLL